jgi:hypothetical protein
MRKTTTALLAAAAALPLALLSAVPATAAVGQVTAEFTTAPTPGTPGSNTITGTYTFAGGAQPTACYMYDSTGNIGVGTIVDAGSASATTTAANVPSGTYTMEWFCDGGQTTETDPSPYWGTPGAIPTFPGSDGEPVAGGPATATAQTIVVAPAAPADPGCGGSVCLPTGSFLGF